MSACRIEGVEGGGRAWDVDGGVCFDASGATLTCMLRLSVAAYVVVLKPCTLREFRLSNG
jgi:hypothetical protein